nr:hypothetical protein [uncultured Methanobacterium sp.]
MAIEWPEWKQVIFSKGLGPIHVIYTATKAALIALDERINDVEAGTVAPASIGNSELEPDSVDSNKINYFLSDEQTGTGATAQNIAHGLSAEPSLVLIIPSLVGTDGATITFTKGSANVNVTATTGAKYRVFAIL